MVDSKVEKKFFELIYAGHDVEDLCQKQWPDCKIGDASDYIHTERFKFEAEIEDDEFYPFAIKNGFADCCLTLQVMMKTPGENGIDKVKHWMDIAIPDWQKKHEQRQSKEGR